MIQLSARKIDRYIQKKYIIRLQRTLNEYFIYNTRLLMINDTSIENTFNLNKKKKKNGNN